MFILSSVLLQGTLDGKILCRAEARHTRCPGLPYSGIARPSRDWGHVCPKHTVSSVTVLVTAAPLSLPERSPLDLCPPYPSPPQVTGCHHLPSPGLHQAVCLWWQQNQIYYWGYNWVCGVIFLPLSICISKWSTVRHWSPTQMPSVQDGCHQRCSAGWPPPITFPFMSETLTLTPLPLFVLHHCFSLHLFFP